MSVYIKPSHIMRQKANEMTAVKKDEHLAQRREYLKGHSIAETLQLPKKF